MTFVKNRWHCLFVFLYGVLASCATAPATPAPWAASPAAIRAVFPDSEYIAQRGRGATRQQAEAAAAAEIARFMTSQINATMGYTMTANETNGNNTETLETINEAYVKTQIDLFGIRYADDAFYDTPQAENEADPFKKALRYMAARQYARNPNFENANIFGQILYPERMNVEFAEVRTELAGLPQKIDGAKRGALVFIDCPLDFESRIFNSFSEGFTALGFPLTRTKTAAAAICAVTVDEGEQKRESGVYYYPSVQAVLSGASGALWTFNAQAERSAAVTPDVAKRRAYTALAESVNTTCDRVTPAAGRVLVLDG